MLVVGWVRSMYRLGQKHDQLDEPLRALHMLYEKGPEYDVAAYLDMEIALCL